MSDATADAVRSQQPPPGYVLRAVDESSFTGRWGAYCDRAGSKHDALFYCKFDVECRNKKKPIKCTSVKSNVNKHLGKKHSITGSRGLSHGTAARDVRQCVAAAERPGALGMTMER